MTRSVLIVDDDEDARRILERGLRRKGYEVFTAAQGPDGLAQAREHQPNLILMDIRMPVMDGWHAVASLKEDPGTRHIPVWAISSHFAEETAPQVGFQRLLDKPSDYNLLVEEVHAYLQAL